MKTFERPDKEFIELFRRSGSSDKAVALAAQREIAKAIELPLRKGILFGDVVSDIFMRMPLERGTPPEFPLDLLAPGTERQHVAFTSPGHGRIPERHVEADYVMINTYRIASAIDCLLKYASDANWNVLARMIEILEASFTKKMNDDGWHTLLGAAVDRNILVYDADAAAGQLTKRLFSLANIVMKRQSGGNSVTTTGKVTHGYLSPEGIEDIRNWGVDQLDEVSRREVYQSADNGAPLSKIYGVILEDMYEFGEGQEYQTYFTSDLSGSLATSDVELCVFIDRNSKDSFIMPIKEEVSVFEDEALHRSQRQGYYAWAELGYGVLDTRRILSGSY